MPPATLPNIVPDRAIEEDDDRQEVSTPEETPDPANRRPPRNNLPEQP
jgi:hypothetical protein